MAGLKKMCAGFIALAIVVGIFAYSEPSIKEQELADVVLKQTKMFAALPTQAELNFSIHEGQIYNNFYRNGPVSAHTVLTSGTSPRLVVAFPAGNSGVGLWFKQVALPIQWQDIKQISALAQENRGGDALYGVEAQITTQAKQLVVEQAVLSSVRVLRDYQQSNAVPDSIQNEVSLNGQSVTWYRDRLDGKGGYKLHIDVIQGHVSGGKGSPVTFTAVEGMPLKFRVQALTGDKPLTPIEKQHLLIDGGDTNANVGDNAKNILAFLSYKEKLLAGSWRFATYFGRDTLMSIRLLMPVLQPQVIAAGLGSVIERLNQRGEVAHEEDLAEFAILRHLRASGELSERPFYDYKMVDDDYLLAPIVAEYLLGQLSDNNSAQAFLRQKTADGNSYGERLLANFEFVISTAAKYAETPKVENLIKINQGHAVGEWRDSGEGLGFGKIPYNVNAVFVPAALTAIARLYNSGLLEQYIVDKQVLQQAEFIARAWQKSASSHFKVTLSAKQVKQAVTAHAKRVGVSADMALLSITDAPLTFNAISLDAQGMPVAVLHSDDGFAMLFSNPSDRELMNSTQAILRPYPAGLLTPVGMLVANAVYADESVQPHFSNQHYHGEVIWSWQQALFAAGLERQLLRSDLAENTRKLLMLAQEKLWQVINAADEINNAELWSWSFKDGQYQIQSFGQRSGDKTESNAAQLWSTVYLAISSPSAGSSAE